MQSEHPITKLTQLPYRIIVGLMSGTSMDGIDAALCKITGNYPNAKVELLNFGVFSYTESTKYKINNVFNGSLPDLCESNLLIGKDFARAVRLLKGEGSMDILSKKHFLKHSEDDLGEEINLIGSHGQTIWHIPKNTNRESSSLQIGDGAVIAEELCIPVVSDFRSQDIAAGGQGAPIVPLFDHQVFSSKEHSNIALNIGGIANITVVTPELENVYAFDTGPGNSLIDLSMQIFYNKPFDQNGEISAKGIPSEKLVNTIMQHPYFVTTPPKSTGKELFNNDFLNNYKDIWNEMRHEDIVASMCFLTAKSIGLAISDHVKQASDVKQVIASGGGIHNKTLMKFLKQTCEPIVVTTSDKFGIHPDAKEAMAMAFLANETIFAQPGNVPNATGATRKSVLGKISLP